MTEKKQQRDTQKKTKKSKKQDELTALKQQADEYLHGWQRAQADYANLQKATQTEKQQLARFIKAEVLQEFFPILDNFRLAVAHIPEEVQGEGWVQGFVHLQNQFDRTLEQMGVAKIKTVGEQFDVATMEAVEMQESTEVESGTVIKEVRPGYKMDEYVIVPAKVIVAK